MKKSNAHAHWTGKIKDGRGTLKFTGYEGAYTFASRFENGRGTNPEELVGAAVAGCFSMYLSLLITEEGLTPENIDTMAEVTMDRDDIGPNITEITLDCKVKCSGLDEDKLKKLAAVSKERCPVSRLYAGGTARISVDAQLVG
ncbi:MAG TPA: peroxiredoxin [Bacteroidales bacterium]|nr:peroxiredoxin [Bacteroidales bacterium]